MSKETPQLNASDRQFGAIAPAEMWRRMAGGPLPDKAVHLSEPVSRVPTSSEEVSLSSNTVSTAM